MNLSELIKTQRSTPHRTWNFASSAHWYDGDDFWLEMITKDPIYRGAMIETEAKLITTICEAVQEQKPYDAFVALGPGDSAKELQLLKAFSTPLYVPIDINKTQLELATRSAQGPVHPIHAEFREGLAQAQRSGTRKFVYLGSTYSNLDAFDYDLLAAIDDSLHAGDAFYVSVQTCPDNSAVPLILTQYENIQYTQLTERLAGLAGVTIGAEFSRFNPINSNLEVGASVATVSGAAQEIGVQSGDAIITMISHKPKALQPELEARFSGHYGIETYKAQHIVSVRGIPYTSTFEGAILTKR